MNLLFIQQPGIIKMDRKGTELIIMLHLLALSVGQRCDLCPPGKYMETACLEGFPNSTECVICAHGTFLSRPNLAEGCFVHKVCDKPNMVTTFRGNTTHDAVCGCEVSYHLDRGSCERNEYCEAGEGIVDNGRKCETCTNGTYSDKLSNVEPCLPWTNCSEYGRGVAKEGTASSDRVCFGQSTEESTMIIHSTTVAEVEETTFTMDEINTPPTTNTIALIVVSIVVGVLGLPGIYILLARKECKHCKNKRQEVHDMQVEDAILVLEGSNISEAMQNSVECEEDTISTNPKVRQSPDSLDQADSKCLIHTDSKSQLLPSVDMLIPGVTDSAIDNIALEPEDEEPVPEEERPIEQSNPIEIPPASPEEPLVSPSTLASSRETSASSLAYREEGVDLVLDVYSKELTNRQMEQLAAEIGHDWPYLAERLGLDRSQVDHTLNDYKGDMQEQVYVMLQNWRQGKTGNATISDLHDALIECNRGELCRRLLSLSEAHSLTSPGPHAPPGADAVT